jgi:NAD(P)-dependent dehydrogenase (short-subunit alcohol dehydrogenase family)/acyl carrier protein
VALAELALRAGAEVGAAYLEDLVLEAPLLLPEQGAVRLQVTVRPSPSDSQLFELAIHSGSDGLAAEDDAIWQRHASGTLRTGDQSDLDFDPTAWPPPGAERIDVTSFYDLAADVGIEYGPAFQGLDAAWRLGDEIFAEVSLAEEQRSEADRFGIHPALLDAAGHAAVLAALEDRSAENEVPLSLPFSFGGVVLGAGRGASSLRLRIDASGEHSSLQATTPDGVPACTIESFRVRPADPSKLGRTSTGPRDLFEIQWSPAQVAQVAEVPAPDGVEVCRPAAELLAADPAAAAHAATAWALGRIQEFLGADPDREGRLAFVTQSAVATSPDEDADPSAAAIWGLVRSAQNEHLGRFLLVDTDGGEASEGALSAALTQKEEVQLAIREGRLLTPRLAPLDAETGRPETTRPLGGEGTVLITGGLSGLGALTARHLAAADGAHRLLLLSRRGPEAPGAEKLIAELAEAGCEAEAVACDVSDRAQLQAVLDSIPEERPLSAVVHCAAGLADGLVLDIGPRELDAALAAKADGAWHLHELTRERNLEHFVLYSSGAGALGNPGQASYAAANAFLDALAQRRRAEGLPATAIAWGLWEDLSELTARVTEENRARMNRAGLLALPTDRGLELLDLSATLPQAHLLAVPLDPVALRRLSRAGILPPLFSRLVRASRVRARTSSGSLSARLVGVAAGDRDEVVLALVREHVAAILGQGVGAVDPAANFKDMGFDSLGAVELRNRLTQATGLRLEATLIFDQPTPEAVAEYLLEQALGEADTGSLLGREFDRLEAALANLAGSDREELVGRLRTFNSRCHELIGVGADGDGSLASADLDSASDEELFELIDREAGG